MAASHGKNCVEKMDGKDDSSLLKTIHQYQNSIKKHAESGNDEKVLHYITKLYEMPITVAHLQETGIGKTVNSLRKHEGSVGAAAKAVVYKWKNMVAEEECEDTENQEETPTSSESPPPSNEKIKSTNDHKKEDRHKKHEKSSKNSYSSKSKSHHRKEEKHNSHKTSHSKEKEHRSHSESTHNRKRKHELEDSSSSRKKRYTSHSSSDQDSNDFDKYLAVNNSSSQSDDYDHYHETTQSPTDDSEPISKPKKHDKSDKHRSSDKKSSSSSSSSKKSSHRDSKYISESSKRDKPSTSNANKTDCKDSKSKHKSSSSEKLSSSKVKKEILIDDDNGIDCGSGASFAEALGMIEPINKSVKKKYTHPASPTPSSSSSTPVKSPKVKPSVNSPLTQSPNLLSTNLKLEPLELNIPAQVPEITTNYKPLTNLSHSYDSPLMNIMKDLSHEEALSVAISTKTQRTKVYSGNKSNWKYVPSLFNLCVRILQDNIDALEYTGGVPYEILKPVLERATTSQLLNVEYYNPYLIDDTDELWKIHCKKECRGLTRQEMESWRDMYMRCRDERDAKLRALTVNIKQSIDKSTPVRQTKLAYVDNYVKPPRNIARKQAKYGTDKKPIITPTARLNLIASGNGDKITVPNPGARAASTSAAALKPKKAPLMQKALALIKSRFRR